MSEDREYEAARARLHARNKADWKRKLEPIPPPAPPKSKHPPPVELKDRAAKAGRNWSYTG